MSFSQVSANAFIKRGYRCYHSNRHLLRPGQKDTIHTEDRLLSYPENQRIAQKRRLACSGFPIAANLRSASSLHRALELSP